MAARQDTAVRHPHLPEGWLEAPLGTVADVRFSSVDKLAYPSEEPVRLCNYLDVYKNDYITGDLGFMGASATQPEIDRFGLQVGDVIVTKDSETPYDIGIPAVVDYAAPDLVCGYHLGLIRPDKAEIDPTFLAKQLGHARIAGYFAGQANGLTRYGLPIGSLVAAPLWLPPLAEQGAAGRLFRLVDQAITQTQAVIAKLKQTRTGLLHDLLTRGLDENGELRDPIARPEQFKNSPLGKIPLEWTVLNIQQLLANVAHPFRSGPFGSALLKSELKPAGIPLLGIDNVHVERFSGDFSRFVGEEKLRELQRYAVRPYDIMITVMGTVGRCCVVPHDIGTALSSKHVWTVSLDLDRYSPSLACWQINNAPWVLRQLRRDEQGGVMTAIRSETLRALLLPVPRLQEMDAIDAVVRESTAYIAREENELDKLRLLKSGLTSDLLTGRVRVPPDLLENPA